MSKHRLRIALIVLAVVAALGAAGCAEDSTAPTPTADREVPPVVPALVPGCTIPTTPADLSSAVPNTMSEDPLECADTFSWLSFIALTWPADETTCTADTGKGPGDAGPMVWESYLEAEQIFVSTGRPAGWCPQQVDLGLLPAGARELAASSGVTRVMSQVAKSSPRLVVNLGGILESTGEPLVDQNGRFVRYEKHVNHDEYKYILGNDLWSKAGQTKFQPPVDMPAGPTELGPTGAIEIKAAWKVLENGDDPSKFFTTEAIVFNDAEGSPSPGKNPVTLGLVGLHIVHKLPSQTNWIWSTFEHLENDTKLFHDAGCKPAQCPPNTSTAKKPYRELGPDGKPLNRPTQVVRLTPVETEVLNKMFWELLSADNVIRNYQLIETQWTGDVPDASGGAAFNPPVLANSVIETYIQETSSCIECHMQATLAGQPKVQSDFSFLLSDAQ